MGGLAPAAGVDRGIEALLRRDRRVVAASLVVVAALAWAYLWLDATTTEAAAAAAAPDPSGGIRAGALAMTFVMWSIMMVGMMLPGVAPTLLLYAAMVRGNAARGTVLPAVWVFASGYLGVWAAFSVAATALQAGLDRAGLLTPSMVSASRWLSAVVLVAAGVFQLTALKRACLAGCREPMGFLLAHWRPGRAGALRMGARHGVYCLGCCWALMLLLFVVGVMNLLWVAALAAYVLIEKLAPAGGLTSRAVGIALVLAGLFALT